MTPPLYHTTFLNLIHSYKFFHSAQRRKPEHVSSSVFFLPVNEDLSLCVCVCRTGGSCGLMTHSGACCSRSSYWSSCSYGDRQPITRGKGGMAGLVVLFFWTFLSFLNCEVKPVCLSVRYAFSPLLDEESEEEEKEPMMNEAFGQKLLLPPFLSLPFTSCLISVSPPYHPQCSPIYLYSLLVSQSVS